MIICKIWLYCALAQKVTEKTVDHKFPYEKADLALNKVYHSDHILFHINPYKNPKLLGILAHDSQKSRTFRQFKILGHMGCPEMIKLRLANLFKCIIKNTQY